MAILFTRTNSLLLLVPKTGSTWIRNKIKEIDLGAKMVGYPDARDHDELDRFNREDYNHIGAFIRNPVDWYRSYWSHRQEIGWSTYWPIDTNCGDDDFPTFIRNVVERMPGVYSDLLEAYVGPPHDEIDFIGSQENLLDDYLKFFKHVGEDVDVQAFRAGDKANTAKVLPEYPEELKDLVRRAERKAMDRFGYV